MERSWTLVTGANGFVGARLVRKLVERGEKVKALVRAGGDLTQLEGLPRDQVRIAQGDVRMVDRVFAALTGCDKMYHVAGTVSFNESAREDILADAVLGTESTLEAARRAGLSRIVVTSSVATLGARESEEELDETAEFELAQANSYAEAKHAAEALALGYASRGLPVVVVNPAMIVGPGDAKPTPIGNYVKRYLSHSPSFRVPTPAGGFPYVDVDDVAEGHILAMEKGRVGERYILSSENLSNREMLQLLSDVTGLAEPGDDLSRGKAELVGSLSDLMTWWSGTPSLLSRKLVDNYYGRYLYVSSDKAKKELGFSPRPAREAFARSCRWYLDHGRVPARAARRARLELHPG